MHTCAHTHDNFILILLGKVEGGELFLLTECEHKQYLKLLPTPPGSHFTQHSNSFDRFVKQTGNRVAKNLLTMAQSPHFEWHCS